MQSKVMWAVVVIAASGAMEAAAQAPGNDSSEDYRSGYRAGYDDGFQRGYDKAMREAGNQAPAPVAVPAAPPRATGPIVISRAVYGNGSHVCDASRWAARIANGRTTATLDASNDICGDPAKGERKSLDVTYVCGSIAKSSSAYEHRSVSLDCLP
jgi:hypothetical protein